MNNLLLNINQLNFDHLLGFVPNGLVAWRVGEKWFVSVSTE